MAELVKVALVTGAARGIGRAVALRLGALGMPVAVLDLSKEEAETVAGEIVAAGGRAIGVAADVADEHAVTQAVDRVVRELGPPVVLVNNAGITRDNLLFKMTLDDWDTVLGVHLRGSFLLSRAVQQHMTAAGWGRIVNLSSTAALGNRGQANYSAAKAGLQGFTRTLAIELGRFGITVNAIAPGFIETEMTVATAARMGIDFEELKRRGAAEIAVRRIGRPDDIAHAVDYLVGDGAGFVSGQVLYVSGGPTV